MKELALYHPVDSNKSLFSRKLFHASSGSSEITIVLIFSSKVFEILQEKKKPLILQNIEDFVSSSSYSALSDSDIGCHSMVQNLVFCQSNNVHASSIQAFAYPTEKCLSLSSSIYFSFYSPCYNLVFYKIMYILTIKSQQRS